MIVSVLLAAMLQTATVGSPAWNERHQPDMPVLPPCMIDSDTKIVYSMQNLLTEVVAEINRFFDAAIPMSDAGGNFNSTDVFEGPAPNRRFLRALQVNDYVVIWYELGGRVAGPRTIAPRRSVVRGTSALRIEPATVFAGDLCAATKAIVSGVRRADP